MTVQWLVASLHLLALGIGLGAVFARARMLRGIDLTGLPRLFLADNLWGLAGFLWLTTGLARAFAGLEKGTEFYMSQPIFHVKITLFVIVLGLELWQMVTLIRWRGAMRRGAEIDFAPSRTMARLSHAQAGLVVIMVLLATALARGVAAA